MNYFLSYCLNATVRKFINSNMGVCIPRSPALCLAPGPGPGLQFVLTGPDPQVVFTGPGQQFCYQSGAWRWIYRPCLLILCLYLRLRPSICITGLGPYLYADFRKLGKANLSVYAHKLLSKFSVESNEYVLSVYKKQEVA